MRPETKSGYIALLIGILGYIGVLCLNSENNLFNYLSTAVLTPFIIYGIAMMFNPNTRREKIGQIPFRGW